MDIIIEEKIKKNSTINIGKKEESEIIIDTQNSINNKDLIIGE